jgi:1-deoxy-D-xylulose-5-phosphate reductoisomerase
VAAFLDERIGFFDIPRVIETTLEAGDRRTDPPSSLKDVRAIDAWSRQFSAQTIRTLPSV